MIARGHVTRGLRSVSEGCAQGQSAISCEAGFAAGTV